jgi:hypothetical protein
MRKKLPKKWCIKNCQEVGEWFNEQTNSKTYTSEFHLPNYLHSYNDMGESVLTKRANKTFSKTKPNFTEITIEQFREFIGTSKTKQPEDYNYLIKILKKHGIK